MFPIINAKSQTQQHLQSFNFFIIINLNYLFNVKSYRDDLFTTSRAKYAVILKYHSLVCGFVQ